jgi:hypothetical protein
MLRSAFDPEWMFERTVVDQMQLPEGFPLKPVDAHGRTLASGRIVTILEASSCSRGLPEEDRGRLLCLVGQKRAIVGIDRSGFVWLSFSPTDLSEDFCLRPSEVASE